MATAQQETNARRSLSLPEAVAAARDGLGLFSEMPIDQIVSCRRNGDDWLIEIDVIEASARLGDNDLLATYALTVSDTGDILGIERQRRYTREDLKAASS